MKTARARSVLRDRSGATRVTFVELFFDLVFVFAITQLSHLLLQNLSIWGAAQTLLLLLGVWWVWIYTSWATNWADPDTVPVRMMMLTLMIAGLILSVSLPEAFESRGLSFACAYVFMQVARSLFMMWALKPHSTANYRNFQRITIWFCLAAVLWLAGAFLDGGQRFIAWAAALAIEFVSPALSFWVPGLGRSATADWNIEGGHMAERSGLFIIICLGESILVTGATFAQLPYASATIAAFTVAFIGSVAMWWLYFDIGAGRATHLIEKSSDPGRIARTAYTYVPIVIVAGIVVSAVADELILAHPLGHTEAAAAMAIIGGPALFILGNLLFKYVTSGWPPLSHMAGLGLFGVLALGALHISPLVLATCAAAILVIVAVWERISLRHTRATAHS